MLYSIKEVSALTGLSYQNIIAKCKAGSIVLMKKDKHWYVNEAMKDILIKKSKKKGGI